MSRFAPRTRTAATRVQLRYRLSETHRDDLVSAGYLGLWKALQNRRPDAHEYELSAYVSRRIEGAVIDEARQILSRLVRCASVDPMALDAEPAPARLDEAEEGEAWPEAATARQVRWTRVEDCLGRVDSDDRSLVLGLAAGFSVAELARAEGTSAGRLQSRVGRIARTLRARAPELRRILRDEL